MARQTTISIETTSRVVVQTSHSVRAWCPGCAAESEFIPVVPVPAGFGAAAVVWMQCIGSAGLHRVASRGGTALICLRSLLAFVEANQTSGAQCALQLRERK
ncbi:MAG TPA: hypothetical protein VJS11_01515 [Acidobacteriaceae bacterium]|nr:hypothetical protein [Acidobacteriaceae bacterium]